MMKWVDEITNRERLEELLFRKRIFLIKWSDHLIWSIEFYLITSSFNSSCMNKSITNRICLFEMIWIVKFFINMLTSNQVVLRSFSRDDLFKSRWFLSYLLIFEIVERSMSTKMSIRFWWDQIEVTKSSKTSWSKEKSLVTIEDLDSQKNLDESWDEESVNEIVKREFLYIELDFSSRLDRQQLAIHSFVSQ
jgi:hypothetical protein